MRLGFSFSPGGLLLPYHLGVISSLLSSGYITETTPVAGSSAGAIAVASLAAGVPPERALEGTCRVASRCAAAGGARGRLLPEMSRELESLLPHDAHEVVNARPAAAGVAFLEVFPKRRPVLATRFASRDDLKSVVCASSMVPFFSTNFPVALRRRPKRQQRQIDDDVQEEEEESLLERLFPYSFVLDGFFAVPRNRFGCPELPPDNPSPGSGGSGGGGGGGGDDGGGPIRTITVSVFPHASVGLLPDAPARDKISPPRDAADPAGQMSALIKAAMEVPLLDDDDGGDAAEADGSAGRGRGGSSTASSESESESDRRLREHFERGRADADAWIAAEARAEQQERALGQRRGGV
jgi:hypothetical protein